MSKAYSKAEFIRGLSNPEDLVRIPGTQWIITSGHSGHMPDPQGHLYLVNILERRGEEFYPASVPHQLDRDSFGEIAAPDLKIFDAHGLSMRIGSDSVHTLYVVNHGGREAVEVFKVDARGAKPTLSWVGAVILPEWCSANDVAPHPNGGFFVTNLCTIQPDGLEKLFAGEVSGNVLHWTHKDTPITIVPGSDVNAPNGVEISADGQWCFINVWARREVLKLSLKLPVQEKHLITLDFIPDNFTWTDDRKYLIVAGQAADARHVHSEYATGKTKIGIPFKVARIEPDSMVAEELVWYDNEDEFGLGSAALIVGKEVWVGTARHDGIAIFQNPKA